MRTRISLFLVFLGLLMGSGVALQNTNDNDEFVTVPKRYVSQEGLNHQKAESPAPAVVSQFLGIGKEIGEATKEGLNAVVDVAEKFGSTKVGTFVMVMIAWKIVAKDILGIVLGIPVFIGGVCLWIYLGKRLFFGYRVIEKREGKIKTYAEQKPYDFRTKEGRGFAGVFMGIGLVVFVAVMLTVIF